MVQVFPQFNDGGYRNLEMDPVMESKHFGDAEDKTITKLGNL